MPSKNLGSVFSCSKSPSRLVLSWPSRVPHHKVPPHRCTQLEEFQRSSAIWWAAAGLPICCDADGEIHDLILRGSSAGYIGIFYIGGCDFFRFQFRWHGTFWTLEWYGWYGWWNTGLAPKPVTQQTMPWRTSDKAQDELPKCPSLDTVWRCRPEIHERTEIHAFSWNPVSKIQYAFSFRENKNNNHALRAYTSQFAMVSGLRNMDLDGFWRFPLILPGSFGCFCWTGEWYSYGKLRHLPPRASVLRK